MSQWNEVGVGGVLSQQDVRDQKPDALSSAVCPEFPSKEPQPNPSVNTGEMAGRGQSA